MVSSGMKPNASLAGASGIVVLDSETAKDLYPSVIHSDGNTEMIFPYRIAQQIPGWLVQAQQIRDPVKLFLGNLERIVRFCDRRRGFFCGSFSRLFLQSLSCVS